MSRRAPPPVRMDLASATQKSCRGQDERERERDLDLDLGRNLSYICKVLPRPPSSRHCHTRGFSALPPNDDLDRLSLLPDALLCNVVSRLPITDAARTTALSRRWHRVWHSAPLVLVDSHLLPAETSGEGDSGLQMARTDARRFTSAVSGVLAAHPGPFWCVHLNTIHMGEFCGLIKRWLQLLAVKGVQELVLTNNSPWSHGLNLTAALFGMATLTRLHLALCKFPNLAGLPSAATFPNLRELGLCTVALERRQMDFILAGSPVLEIMYLQGKLPMDRLSLASHSLRCVQLIAVSDLEIALEDALHLERLIIWLTTKGPRKMIKIGCAPALSILGYLEPEFHMLHVGSTIIKARTRASPSTMVPTVKILGLKVRFGVHNEAKIVSSYLRCFPNVESLHIESKKTAANTGKLNLNFWEESGAIDCICSHIKLMVFQNFRGHECEILFLKFFLESARMLTKLVIVYGRGSFSSLAEVKSKVKPLFSTKWASNCCSLLLTEFAFSEDEGLEMLNIERGSNFNVKDPFDGIVRA